MFPPNFNPCAIYLTKCSWQDFVSADGETTFPSAIYPPYNVEASITNKLRETNSKENVNSFKYFS